MTTFDDFDEKVEEFIAINNIVFARKCIDIDKFRAIAELMKDSFHETFEKMLDKAIEGAKCVAMIFEEIYEIQETNDALTYKLDFTRRKIQHQVLDRKPKHLIKKVIH